MPELPEVETVCRGLARAIMGTRIMALDVRRKNLRIPIPKDLASRLIKRRVLKIHRRAKYILISLDHNETLIFHLGMSGRLLIDRQKREPEKHDHLVFYGENGIHFTFNDPRRFGLCTLTASDKLSKHKLFKHLGVEPLSPEFNVSTFEKQLSARKVSIKSALMDQRLVVGIGNIYASEALFYAHLRPTRRANSLKTAEIENLITAVQNVLQAALKAGGSSLRNYVQSDGELGYFQNQFSVYGREGKACRQCTCNIDKTGGVQRISQQGRSTFYCAQKQK